MDMVQYVESEEEADLCITTNDTTLQEILQHTIRKKQSQGTEEWVTIIDQAQKEKAILMYNHQHFQQSQETPFGSGTLASLVGLSGLTEASQAILAGSFTTPREPSASTNLINFSKILQSPTHSEA
jgi:ribosomal protein S12 methylthiotransferase accessory factor YcaO